MEDGELKEREVSDLFPDTFMRVEDPEWDATHFSFEDSKGVRYRVARGEVILTPKRGDEIPKQPPVLFAVAFAGNTMNLWYRSPDGWWYPANRIGTRKNRMLWEDLWFKHGGEGYRTLMPISNEQLNITVPLDGPTDSVTIPDMSTGEPQPGLVGTIVDEGLVIYDAVNGVTIHLGQEQISVLFGLYFRSSWQNTLQQVQDGPPMGYWG